MSGWENEAAAPGGLATEKAYLDVPKALRNPTVTERLEMKKAHLEAELETTNAALTALKANPEIERVMNLVQQAQREF